jgi:phosphatidylinositol alpha-1,6-mannosyltransferase
LSNYKILFISSEFPPGPGGIGNQSYNIVKSLNSSGYPTDVITISDFAGKKEINLFDSSVPFRITRFERYSNKFITAVNRYRKLIEVLNVKRYDFIICSGRFSLLLGYLIKKKYKIKTMAIAHGGDINSSNPVVRYITDKAIKSFNRVVAVSRYTFKKLPKGRKQGKYLIIPNGVDLDELGNNNIEKFSGLGSPSLLTVGNVWRRKGQQNVIKHLPLLRQKYPDLHYHCVGKPTEAEYMQKLASKLNVNDYIKFHGKVSKEELFKFYSSADIFVMLSEEQKSGDFEGFGIAILEANSFKLPAIGSVHSGIEDAIEDKFSGILISPNSAEQFLKAVDDIMENREQFSVNARNYAQKHSWNIIIKEYIKVIEEIK